MFTQHRMAFLADTKIKAIWESQNNMTTTQNWYLQLVQVILAERLGSLDPNSLLPSQRVPVLSPY